MPSKKIDKFCEYCKKDYLGIPKSRFCSQKCSSDIKKTKVICLNCNEIIFKPKSKILKTSFCTHHCYLDYKQKNNTRSETQCNYCNKTFTFYSKVQNGNFCSNNCKHLFGQPKKENSKLYKSIKINCNYCNKLFNRKPSELKSDNNNFCSKECYYKSDNCKGVEYAIYMTKECTTCNKPIIKTETFFNHSKNKNHYCSKLCMASGMSGINNHGYNDSLSKEDRENRRNIPEYRQWRLLVFKRDLYTCQVCNRKGDILNAHHLENYSSVKNKRTKINNGITLCIKCHKKFHKIYGKRNNNKLQFEDFKESCNI
jgi:hypothetical protein